MDPIEKKTKDITHIGEEEEEEERNQCSLTTENHNSPPSFVNPLRESLDFNNVVLKSSLNQESTSFNEQIQHVNDIKTFDSPIRLAEAIEKKKGENFNNITYHNKDNHHQSSPVCISPVSSNNEPTAPRNIMTTPKTVPR